MVPEARAEVRRLLRDHAVPALDQDVLRTGDEFVRAFERQVAAP
jgi:hypothetical protein